MLPTHLGDLTSADEPAVSPDGRLIAFSVTSVDLPGNTYRSRIWLVPADGSRPAERLTDGPGRDSSPCWSPDGRRLAFTASTDPAGATPATNAICVLPIDGPGERLTVTSNTEPYQHLCWSPDGRWLAFGQRARAERYTEDDPRRQPPRRITRFFSQLDSTGWIADRPTHVHVVAPDGSRPARDLTPGDFAFDQPAWLADSSGVVVDGRGHETWDLDLAVDLYEVSLDGSRRALTNTDASLSFPSPSPDGRVIAFLGFDNPAVDPQNSRIGILDRTTGQRRWLDTGIDRTWAPYPGAQTLPWLDDRSVLASVEDRGNIHLYRVDIESGRCQLICGGDRKIGATSAAGGTIAFAATSFEQPGEIYSVVDGRERLLSNCTEVFTTTVRPRRADRFTAGSNEVDVWVVTPDGFDANAVATMPMLVNIHGGPFTQTGNTFFDEAQVQARAGYVVVLSNPRGASGRDTAWGRSISGPKSAMLPGTGWGSVDADDVHVVVDEVLRRYPAVDPARVGVLGGSYGGYLTSWLIGHTDRFAAACSERSVNNLLTMEWTSDIGTAFRTELGVTHLDDPEEYLRMSPIRYVRAITTPLLIIHSEDDLRCPISQAEELFTAMRMLGKEVEFVRFPAESHELTRSGSPVHRVQRFELLLEFFAKHLKP